MMKCRSFFTSFIVVVLILLVSCACTACQGENRNKIFFNDAEIDAIAERVPVNPVSVSKEVFNEQFKIGFTDSLENVHYTLYYRFDADSMETDMTDLVYGVVSCHDENETAYYFCVSDRSFINDYLFSLDEIEKSVILSQEVELYDLRSEYSPWRDTMYAEIEIYDCYLTVFSGEYTRSEFVKLVETILSAVYRK